MLFLILTAGANRYAVDVTRVVKVIPKVELRKIPHAPATLAGFLGYRGNVVPVLDLGLLLGAEASRDCLSTRILLVDDRRGDHDSREYSDDSMQDNTKPYRATRIPAANLLGLIAERVTDLVYVQPDQVMPAPVTLPDAPYLGAIVQTEHGIVQLIAVEQIRVAVPQVSYSGQAVGDGLEPGTAAIDRMSLKSEV